jgi:hypothetical protein
MWPKVSNPWAVASRTADAAAAKMSQNGGGAFRRPRRAAPLPSDDGPSFDACPGRDRGLDDLEEEVVDESLAISLM